MMNHAASRFDLPHFDMFMLCMYDMLVREKWLAIFLSDPDISLRILTMVRAAKMTVGVTLVQHRNKQTNKRINEQTNNHRDVYHHIDADSERTWPHSVKLSNRQLERAPNIKTCETWCYSRIIRSENGLARSGFQQSKCVRSWSCQS